MAKVKQNVQMIAVALEEQRQRFEVACAIRRAQNGFAPLPHRTAIASFRPCLGRIEWRKNGHAVTGSASDFRLIKFKCRILFGRFLVKKVGALLARA
ncbi:MAG: hypothetical protein R3D70_00815 [Rhizobiaceae bacterium]